MKQFTDRWPESDGLYRPGLYSAVFTAILTALAFGIAIFTPPLSGPYCSGLCIEYPYTESISRFPRDYLWMYPAIGASLAYLMLAVCIHHYASPARKVFSHAGLLFSLMSAIVLAADYFIQLSVIQPSLVNGEKEGIAMLSQYNPHGLFIVLEELGFILMGISFLCLAPVFPGAGGIEKAIRRILVTGPVLILATFILISFRFGIHREYRFEIFVISIDWIVLIIAGILLAVLFARAGGMRVRDAV